MSTISFRREGVLALALQIYFILLNSAATRGQHSAIHPIEADAAQQLFQGVPDYNQEMEDIFSLHSSKAEREEQRKDQQRLTGAAIDLFALSPTNLENSLLKAVNRQAKGIYSATPGLGKVINDTCRIHAEAFFDGFLGENQTVWAIQMYDAWGKMMPGMLQGAIKWIGGWDQCFGIKAGDPVMQFPPASGKYCTGSMKMSLFPVGTISFGVCMPDSCTDRDFAVVVNEVLKEMNSTDTVSVKCRAEEDTSLDFKAQLAIGILSFFLFCMVLGTAMDILLVQWPKWKKEERDAMDTGFQSLPLLTDKKESKPGEVSTLVKVFLAFSVWTNGSKLLSTNQPPGSLTCIHGIRFMSMTWVVLGHCYSSTKSIASNGLILQDKLMPRWTFQAISNATVSVDSFFLLSGLLVAYLTLKEMKKKSTWKINWFMFYFHRFWRLSPPYLMVILIVTCLTPYMGDGPFWPVRESMELNCQRNWWTNLLYVNNIVNSDRQCLGQGWYLANDMQFYVLSPLIMVPFFFSPIGGCIVSGAFLLATSITPGLIEMNEYFSPATGVQVDREGHEPSKENYFSYFYGKPWNRMGAYVIGLMAGYLLYRCNGKLRINRYLNLVLWAVAAGCAMAVLYGLYDAANGELMPLKVAAFYMAVWRQVWSACVAWVIVACCTGNGGFVNTLLSWPGLVPLSRLTYMMFLLHQHVKSVYLNNLESTFYLTDITMASFFIVVLIYTYMLSFVCSLAFEAPMMGLEKVVFHKPAPPPAKKTPVKNSMSDETSDGLPNGAMTRYRKEAYDSPPNQKPLF